MKKKIELSIALTSVMVAIVVVFTLVVRIPTIGGYVNLSDVAIVFASFCFGPIVGLISGGLGTALADLIAGYPQYIPISFVVHGLEGLILGQIARVIIRKKLKVFYILAFLATIIIVPLGYYLLEAIFLYDFTAALKGILMNTVQAGVGFVGGVIIYFATISVYPPIQMFNEKE